MAFVFAFNVWDMSAAQKDCRPKDCYDLKCYRVSNAEDGPHTIYPSRPGLTSLQVSCDQETDGGGWIMYQRRVDGTVNFTRNWEEYKYGFGDHGDNTAELWLGNENVYQLVQSYGSTEWELRIEADAFDGTSCWLVASDFRMNNETLRYSMYWDSVTESVVGLADDLNHQKLKPFSTLDNSEGFRAKQCVSLYKGGWWYVTCGLIFLNGEYENQRAQPSRSIFVYNFKRQISLERSRMMFRPQNDVRPCNNPCKNGGTCEYNVATNSAKCRCIAELSGSTCEGTHKNTHNDTHYDTHNDTHNDTHSDADSDAYGDAHSDAESVAYSVADSDAYSDAHSDADSGADSDAESDAYSVADSDAHSDAHSDAGPGTDSESGSTLPAVAGGVGLLLFLVLIALAIVVGAIRRRKQRDAECKGPTCEATGSDADSDANSDTDSDAGSVAYSDTDSDGDNSSRSDTMPETA